MLLLENFIALFIESAPWLMLGLTVAGVIKVVVPSQLMATHLGNPGPKATIKAALFGAPLPLCSCGVIPAALGLRRSGASKAATTSFLISTPETGVDSISISYAMLGPFMAIIRPIAAITSAIVAGLIVGRDGDTQNGETSSPTDDCCHSAQTVSHSCDTGANSSSETSISDQLKAGLRFTYLDLVKDIAVWLIIGLGCAALIKTYVPNEFLLQWGDGLLAFVIMAVIGVPMYICATASTPIAAGLLFSGVSPGATLVFMLVGPATNIATMGLVKNELGNRILAIYLISVVAVGFAFGYLTNYLAALWAMDFLAQAHNAHNMINTGVAQTSGIILAGLMAYGIAQKYLPKMTHA
jgi:uncharacterized membrane protein YraQ (UPF0718 family)